MQLTLADGSQAGSDWRSPEHRAAIQTALFNYTDRLHRAQTREEVLNASLDAISEALACETSSILLFDDAGTMRFIAWRGLSEVYRRTAEGHSPWDAGQAFAEAIAIEDVSEADFEPELAEQLRIEGIQSLAFIPMLSSKGVIGKFMMYFDAPHAYEPEELDLAAVVARQLGFALERIQAEARLRESEARYRALAHDGEMLTAIVESSEDAIISKTLEGVIESWNAGAERLFGYSADEVVGRHISILFPSDRMDEEPKILQRIRAGERVEHFDTVRKHKSGRLIDISLTISPMRNAEGEIIGASKIARDITDRKRTEVALVESEERFRNMADHAPVMVWVTDLRGSCSFLSASWYELTGQAPETGLGYGWQEAVHPEDRPAAARAFEEASATGADFNVEYRLRRADGDYRWAIVSARPRRDKDGGFLGYIGSVVDITERKATEERLRRSEAEFRTLADNMSQLAWMTDDQGWIYWYNKRWFDYTGSTLDEMQGWGWQSVHHPDHIDRVTEKFKHHIAAGEPWEDTFPLRGEDGEYRWFLSRAMPIHDDDGNVLRWFGTNTDVTDQKRSEEQRTLLINELNHRVKNTLATVQSLASQTLRGAGSNEDVRAQFEARVLALSRAHDILTAQNWRGSTMRGAIERAVEPFNEHGRMSFSGPPIWLSPKQTLAFAIALHELSTNATKYGALSADDGEVIIEWSVQALDDEADRLLQLEWVERGGPSVRTPEQPGFGTRLIQRGIARDLGADAQLEFRPEGVRAILRSPVEVPTSPAFPGAMHESGK